MGGWACALLAAATCVHAAETTFQLRMESSIPPAAPTHYQPPAPGPAEFDASQIGLDLSSASVMVFDQSTGRTLLEKNPRMATSIASITKLMTAMVVLDAGLPMDETIAIASADVDKHKYTGSRLVLGKRLSREMLLNLALIASENRAAAALARSYPGGTEAFVAAMNKKAQELGMTSTHFDDPTGLHASNRSTAEDLVRLVNTAYYYPDIRRISTTGDISLGGEKVQVKRKVKVNGKRRLRTQTVWRSLEFVNTNRLVREKEWDIGLSKTGYINEAGHCLVMQASIAQQRVIIVLLDAIGKYGRLGDANRIRAWLERSASHQADAGSAAPPGPG
jgi:D-alanyl-D-alanine endopeptidase (penicillin-binding protein 7)